MLQFFDWIRHCAKCGKSWGCFSWLCVDCKVRLYRSLSVKSRKVSGHIDHHYLFDWKVGDDLNPIVHSLKGGGHRPAIYEMLQTFHVPGGFDLIFYPQGRPKDHAWELSQVFADLYGGETVALEPISRKKQSLLPKKARGQRSFRPFKQPLKHPYFVDDIVTTGATLRAAYQALGQPAKMTVWSLFYRNPL